MRLEKMDVLTRDPFPRSFSFDLEAFHNLGGEPIQPPAARDHLRLYYSDFLRVPAAQARRPLPRPERAPLLPPAWRPPASRLEDEGGEWGVVGRRGPMAGSTRGGWKRMGAQGTVSRRRIRTWRGAGEPCPREGAGGCGRVRAPYDII